MSVTNSRRSRQLYAQPTESSRQKNTFGADESATPATLRDASSSSRPSLAAHHRARSSSPTSTSAPTVVAKSSRNSSSAKTPLRRDQLSSRALGLGDPIALRRVVSPSVNRGGPKPRAGSAARPLWAVSPRMPSTSTPRQSQSHRGPSEADSAGAPSTGVDHANADPALPAVTLPHDHNVRVLITSIGPEAISFVRDPVEQCVVLLDAHRSAEGSGAMYDAGSALSPNGQYYCDGAFLTHAEREGMGNKVANYIARQVTFQGHPSVLFGFGAPGSGKSESLFGERGVAREYVVTLLEELDRTFLSKLWSVHVSAINVVDGQVFDALPANFQSRRYAARDPQDALMAMLEHTADDDFRRAVNLLDNVQSSSAMSDASSAMHAAAHRGLPPIDPLDLFERLAVTIRDADDVDLFFETLTSRARRRTNVTWQEVVHISVVPSLGVQQTFGGLMRSVGSACFVELGAGMSTDEEIRSNPRAASAQRHTVSTVLNVLNALTRAASRQASSSPPPSGATYSVHIPFGDCTLTTLLEPLLLTSRSTLIAHVQENPDERTASLSTLHAVDQLLRHRYPNGRAPVDYKQLARAQCMRADKLQRELDTSKRSWDVERQQLESDRWMLRKAYEDVLQQCDRTPTEQPLADAANDINNNNNSANAAIHADEPSPDNEHVQQLMAKMASMANSMQSLKAMLATVQREKCVLEEQQKDLSEQFAQLSVAHETLVDDNAALLARYHKNRSAAKNASATADTTNASVLALSLELLGYLSNAELVSVPSFRHGHREQDLETVVVQTSAALLQLSHQLCEREKYCECLAQQLRDATASHTHDRETAVRTKSKQDMAPPSRTASSIGRRHHQANGDALPIPLLKWQTWRVLLERLQRVVHPLAEHADILSDGMSTLPHFNGVMPKGRGHTGMSLFHFAASSSPSMFLNYWSSSDATESPLKPSPSKMVRTSPPRPQPIALVPRVHPPTMQPLLNVSQGSERTSTPGIAALVGLESASLDSPRGTQLVDMDDPDVDEEDHNVSAIERLARQLTGTLESMQHPPLHSNTSAPPRLSVTQPSASTLSDVSHMSLSRQQPEALRRGSYLDIGNDIASYEHTDDDEDD